MLGGGPVGVPLLAQTNGCLPQWSQGRHTYTCPKPLVTERGGCPSSIQLQALFRMVPVSLSVPIIFQAYPWPFSQGSV